MRSTGMAPAALEQEMRNRGFAELNPRADSRSICTPSSTMRAVKSKLKKKMSPTVDPDRAPSARRAWDQDLHKNGSKNQ
jgi:hypothetical protein